MFLLPYHYEDFGFQYPRRLMNQHYTLALPPGDLVSAVPLRTRKYYRPWRYLPVAGKNLASSIMADGDEFEINLDVQHFAPDEITVKTANGRVVVEGKHEEEDEHGFSCRQFVRRYLLPDSALPSSVESHLSSDGVLTITALTKLPEALQGGRQVPIAQTGPVRNKNKDQSNEHNGPVRMENKDQSNRTEENITN